MALSTCSRSILMRALAPTASAATACCAPHWAWAKQQQAAGATPAGTASAAFSSQAAPGGEPTKPAGAKDDYGTVMRHTARLATQHEQVAPGEVGLVSGMPDSARARQATIGASARTAGMSGRSRTVFNHNAPQWSIQFDTTDKWVNPVMGWTSSGDTQAQVGAGAALNFHSREEAEAFCRRQGWAYSVQAPEQPRSERNRRFAGYGDNFSVKRAGLPDLSTLPSRQQQQQQQQGRGPQAGAAKEAEAAGGPQQGPASAKAASGTQQPPAGKSGQA